MRGKHQCTFDDLAPGDSVTIATRVNGVTAEARGTFLGVLKVGSRFYVVKILDYDAKRWTYHPTRAICRLEVVKRAYSTR